MKYIIFICTIIIAFVSCKNPKTESTNHDWKFETLFLDKTVYIDNDSSKQGMKFHLEFTYPSSYTNDTILNYVQNIFVRAYVGDTINLKPKEAFNKLENEYTIQALELGKQVENDGSDFSYYYQTVVTNISDSSNIENYITIETKRDQYHGGAHGSYNTMYCNIDTRSGDQITEDILFKDNYKSPLTILLQKLLIERANTNSDDAITLFDSEEIEPNGNFYFSKDGIVYVYNTYEIAPYSDGIIEVTLPYAKIKDIINPNYNFLLAKDNIE